VGGVNHLWRLFPRDDEVLVGAGFGMGAVVQGG